MQEYNFENAADLEIKLSSELVTILQHAIAEKGFAHMLVSGGSTPKKLFEQLAKENVDWSKVTIGLVDERFVPTSDDASNEKMLKQTLLQKNAHSANFIGMVHEPLDYVQNLTLAKQAYEPFFQKGIDITILGMGNDGHTASLFPGDQASENDLLNANLALLNTNAPVHPTQRITCSKAFILSSKNLFLMLVGDTKKQALTEAMINHLPISHFTSHPQFKLYFSL